MVVAYALIFFVLQLELTGLQL